MGKGLREESHQLSRFKMRHGWVVPVGQKAKISLPMIQQAVSPLVKLEILSALSHQKACTRGMGPQ